MTSGGTLMCRLGATMTPPRPTTTRSTVYGTPMRRNNESGRGRHRDEDDEQLDQAGR